MLEEVHRGEGNVARLFVTELHKRKELLAVACARGHVEQPRLAGELLEVLGAHAPRSYPDAGAKRGMCLEASRELDEASENPVRKIEHGTPPRDFAVLEALEEQGEGGGKVGRLRSAGEAEQELEREKTDEEIADRGQPDLVAAGGELAERAQSEALRFLFRKVDQGVVGQCHSATHFFYFGPRV